MEIINKIIKNILISTILITNLAFGLTGDAGQEVALLDFGYGAKAFALGSAYVAHQPDVTSLHWNPAALGFAQKKEIATMQNKLSSDADYYYLGTILPGKIATFGISWVQLEIENIPQTTTINNNNEVEILNQLTYQENGITIGFGKKITNKFSLGLNAKYISKLISDNLGEGKGYSSSLGILYLINKNMNLGLVADNIKNQQIYDTGTKEVVPTKYTAGFCLKTKKNINILLATEKRADKESLYKGHYGLEFLFSKNLQLLLGYNYDRLTAGASFSINNISIDYAYIAENSYNLGAEHFVTAGVKW